MADGDGVVTDENLFHEKSNDTLALRNVQRLRRRAHARHERRERLGQSQIVSTIIGLLSDRCQFGLQGLFTPAQLRHADS